MNDSKTRQFLVRNWFNLLTLLVATFALMVSIQANQVAKEANQVAVDANQVAVDANQVAVDANQIAIDANQIANQATNSSMRLVAEANPSDRLVVSITGCYSKVSSKHEIVRYITEEVTLTNTGGNATALVAVSFSDGYDRYYRIEVLSDRPYGTENVLTLPLQFNAGETKLLHLNAKSLFSDGHRQPEQAIDTARGLKQLVEPSSATWKLSFADGTVLERPYASNFYSVSPFFETYLGNECGY